MGRMGHMERMGRMEYVRLMGHTGRMGRGAQRMGRGVLRTAHGAWGVGRDPHGAWGAGCGVHGARGARHEARCATCGVLCMGRMGHMGRSQGAASSAQRMGRGTRCVVHEARRWACGTVRGARHVGAWGAARGVL